MDGERTDVQLTVGTDVGTLQVRRIAPRRRTSAKTTRCASSRDFARGRRRRRRTDADRLDFRTRRNACVSYVRATGRRRSAPWCRPRNTSGSRRSTPTSSKHTWTDCGRNPRGSRRGDARAAAARVDDVETEPGRTRWTKQAEPCALSEQARLTIPSHLVVAMLVRAPWCTSKTFGRAFLRAVHVLRLPVHDRSRCLRRTQSTFNVRGTALGACDGFA